MVDKNKAIGRWTKNKRKSKVLENLNEKNAGKDMYIGRMINCLTVRDWLADRQKEWGRIKKEIHLKF